MDIFIEQIVKKKLGAKDFLIILAVFLGGCIIVALCAMVIPWLLLFVLIGVIAAAYYLITSRSVEFEYSVTNSDITIDKIINRRKRKHVISVDAHDIETMGKYNSKESNAEKYSARINVSENDNGNDAWYFVARHPQRGNIFVLFNPNEKVLASIKPFLTRQVAINAFGRN